MSEVITELKALKLFGMAQSYAELLEHGGTAAMQSSHWLIEHLLAAERTDRALRTTIRYQVHIARFPVHQIGAEIAKSDAELAEVRFREPYPRFWRGFDIATRIFGNTDCAARDGRALPVANKCGRDATARPR